MKRPALPPAFARGACRSRGRVPRRLWLAPLCFAGLGLSVLAAVARLLSPPSVSSVPTLGAVVPLTSLETEWAADALREALRVAAPVVVVYSDHLSDGTPEDLGYVSTLQRELAGAPGAAALVWVPVHWHAGRTLHFWMRYLRWAGLPFVPLSTDYVLWIDADEVLDVERFVAWWGSPLGLPASGAGACKLANYVYFREPRFQSIELEDSVVVSRRAHALHSDAFFEDPHKSREAFFDDVPGGGPRGVRALDGEPLVHHFSWARSKEVMLKKVRAWGHSAERDWVALVEAEFTHEFTGTDFVHGHKYRTLSVPWIEELRARRRAAVTYAPTILK
jgi:hypothetical protein